jgi:hypothetical protein
VVARGITHTNIPASVVVEHDDPECERHESVRSAELQDVSEIDVDFPGSVLELLRQSHQVPLLLLLLLL